MVGSFTKSKVDDLMYFVLKKTEKPVSYGESVGTTECMWTGIAQSV